MSTLKYAHLSDSDPNPLAVSPETLIATLDTGLCNMTDLCETLHCTPDDLADTLDDPRTNRLIETKARLAAARARLISIQYIPHAICKLQELVDTSEKPEVVRRSATTLINLAGIPTTAPHPPQSKTPANAQPDEPQYTKRTERQEYIYSSGVRMLIQRIQCGVDLAKIPDHLEPAWSEHLCNFFYHHKIPILGDFMDPPPPQDLTPDNPPPPTTPPTSHPPTPPVSSVAQGAPPPPNHSQ